jgi:hypothetical protein
MLDSISRQSSRDSAKSSFTQAIVLESATNDVYPAKGCQAAYKLKESGLLSTFKIRFSISKHDLKQFNALGIQHG